MKKIIIYFLILIVLLGVSFFVFKKEVFSPEIFNTENLAKSPKDATYNIDGNIVTLKNGVSSLSVDDSSAEIVTTYFGNELYSDLNNDGRDDVVFLIMQETGGTGVFCYVVSAINTKNGYRGGEAFYVGDRIAPQNINNIDNKIVVNYADRAEGESFAEEPTVGKSLYLKFNSRDLKFEEVR